MNKKLILILSIVLIGLICVVVYIFNTNKQEELLNEYSSMPNTEVQIITIDGIVERLNHTDDITRNKIYDIITELKIEEGTLCDVVPDETDYYSDIIYNQTSDYNGDMYWTLNIGDITYIFYQVDDTIKYISYAEG